MALAAKGTVFNVQVSSTMVSIGCLESISGFSNTVDSLEVTCLSDSVKQFIPSQSDPGEITVVAQYDLGTNTAQDQCYSDSFASTSRLFEVVFANGDTLGLEGFVSGFSINGIDIGGKVTIEVKFKITAAWDYDEGV